MQKALKTYHIFGLSFFLHYAFKFAFAAAFRRNAVAGIFGKNGVTVTKLEDSINHENSLAKIRDMQPDLLVSILGNEIFRPKLLEIAPCLNLHTAPLPRYRGLMPSFWVLKNREKETAVSVFLVDEGIDSGPIVVQKPVLIGNMTQEELIRKSKEIGLEAIAEAIDIFAQGEPKLILNDAEKATYFAFPTKKDVAEFRAVGARFY